MLDGQQHPKWRQKCVYMSTWVCEKKMWWLSVCADGHAKVYILSKYQKVKKNNELTYWWNYVEITISNLF